jgi:hypothetical protein
MYGRIKRWHGIPIKVHYGAYEDWESYEMCGCIYSWMNRKSQRRNAWHVVRHAKQYPASHYYIAEDVNCIAWAVSAGRKSKMDAGDRRKWRDQGKKHDKTIFYIIHTDDFIFIGAIVTNLHSNTA